MNRIVCSQPSGILLSGCAGFFIFLATPSGARSDPTTFRRCQGVLDGIVQEPADARDIKLEVGDNPGDPHMSTRSPKPKFRIT